MASLTKAALLALAGLQGVNAWGVLGHATVAYIAQHYLTSEAASWSKRAQGILGDSSDSYLASIASWADQYRATAGGKWTAPFHFIDAEDNPPSSCNLDYERDCGNSGCSISAVANYTQRVTDGRLADDEVADALKFIVHFIGDLTQPLHDEAYELGGNHIKVTFDDHSDNLHADWDTYMPEKLIGGHTTNHAQTWSKTLIKDITSGSYKSQAASWIEGDDVGDAIATATRWATDANALVCTFVMPNGPDDLKSGDLYPDYYNSVISTIELQIAKAGYRLGNWLNMVHKAGAAKRTEGGVEVMGAIPLPDLLGRDLLPAPRPMSRAKLARAAMEGSCCGHEHD
ncbi:Nuclease P1 [Tolypocladium capitatum]|uniref:Nuclease P1 n=1 Tax=Tolypocladium capitatum TaxID=45235 RepID=A0A2K3QM78_9HYPO|nr:Nuclease P1 [Tolypocladium capitatum]